MKKLPWAFWKSRAQVPPPPKRRFHLGIDYGTSNSKVVFRDYGARGGEKAVLVLRNGSFRIPSRVCVTTTEFLFGDEHKSTDECDVYESVKMIAAAESSQSAKYYFGPTRSMPRGFSAADLATLTVWFLISEGHRAIDTYLSRKMEGVSIGMTMGVPMSFFRDRELRSLFLNIARRAWSIYRQEGLLGPTLFIDRGREMLQKYPWTSVPATSDPEIRDWIRSEGEAAMWWPFQSPAVAAGPYAKVDIGAGTTHASLFRIFGTTQTPKTGLAFFGAFTVPFGMDAVDSAIAESQGQKNDCLMLRGRERAILQENAKARGALIPVQEQIYEAYRRSWIETHGKIKGYVAELKAWSEHRIFVIGGGSLVPLLVETVRIHPGRRAPLRLATLEQPTDLVRPDDKRIGTDELPFVTVAYGLSNIGLSIPEAFTPDEIPPMPDQTGPRARIDHEDIYAK
jgi:hypothetical protein